MINVIKKYFESNNTPVIKDSIQPTKDPGPDLELIKRRKLAELKELLRITNCNINYIKAYLNTLGSVANNTKGDTAAETRNKRQWVKSKIEWLNRKVEEEIVMSKIYENQIKRLV